VDVGEETKCRVTIFRGPDDRKAEQPKAANSAMTIQFHARHQRRVVAAPDRWACGPPPFL